MAFLFEVETGTASPTANSYTSVEFADDYMVANIHATSWAAATVETKEYLLVWASRYLDQRARWFGKRVSADSGLRWPRSGVRDRDGFCIESDEIPIQLQQATVELARYLLDTDRSVERGQDGLKRIRVDVIEIEFDKNYRLSEIPNEIYLLIDGLGVLRSGMPTHAPIRRR